jgi:NTE family protein
MINRKALILIFIVSLTAFTAGGCAHYKANPFLKGVSPESGYRLKNLAQSERSDQLILVLAFSGGGTRAASLAYGVLEELAETKILLEGRERFLLDEVDVISSVSGGSFTAAYYGLFGRRIFEDFESRFLKKNIQKELFLETLDLDHWFRLPSPQYGRSDLAAEYYDQHIFEGRTFGDIAARAGPLILVNATDLARGDYFTFTQEIFDIICSDLSRTPVSRAVAASSAVPIILSPITLYNYAGSCNYELPQWIKKALEEPSFSRRRNQQALHLASYLDAEKRPYIHLVDGGISDNLGLRAAIDRIALQGDIWPSFQYLGWEKTRKVVFILVNAEKEPDSNPDYFEKILSTTQVMQSVTRIQMTRYNFETVELLKENFKKWSEEIRVQRCQAAKKLESENPPDPRRESCADIQFYLVEVDFNALPNPSERAYFRGLSTSFHLPPEAVDRLRAAARRILTQSPEFQRLLSDLKY